MLKSFNEVKSSADQNFPEIWFNKFKQVYNEMFEGKKFNSKFGQKYFNSLYNFYYRDNGPADLRNKIENNQLKDAFYLLKEIDGIGEKIAKFMVRDLVSTSPIGECR